MLERLSLAEATEVTEKKMEKTINKGACQLAKSKRDGISEELIRYFAKKILCDSVSSVRERN